MKHHILFCIKFEVFKNYSGQWVTVGLDGKTTRYRDQLESCYIKPDERQQWPEKIITAWSMVGTIWMEKSGLIEDTSNNWDKMWELTGHV